MLNVICRHCYPAEGGTSQICRIYPSPRHRAGPGLVAPLTDRQPEVVVEGAPAGRLPCSPDVGQLLDVHQVRPGQQHVQPQVLQTLVQGFPQTSQRITVLHRQPLTGTGRADRGKSAGARASDHPIRLSGPRVTPIPVPCLSPTLSGLVSSWDGL